MGFNSAFKGLNCSRSIQDSWHLSARKRRKQEETVLYSLFVPAVRLLHFEMQYDGGTPEQETNLLPFVPIFRPSGLVNLCAFPPPTKKLKGEGGNHKNGIFFSGYICWLVIRVLSATRKRA